MEIEITAHPKWVVDFLNFIEPCKEQVVKSRLFVDMAEGKLSMSRIRGALLNFYPLVENFPVYMGLTLEKVPPGQDRRNDLARDWLMSNINIERRHAVWYREWASDFGISRSAFSRPIVPPARMDAINNYLWRIANRGTLSECLAAINFGIEGPSGDWAKLVERNMRSYAKRPGVTWQNRTVYWIKAHAAYDEQHTPETLELIKLFATTKQEQRRVRLAAQRSMEYYAIAAEASYELFV